MEGNSGREVSLERSAEVQLMTDVADHTYALLLRRSQFVAVSSEIMAQLSAITYYRVLCYLWMV